MFIQGRKGIRLASTQCTYHRDWARSELHKAGLHLALDIIWSCLAIAENLCEVPLERFLSGYSPKWLTRSPLSSWFLGRFHVEKKEPLVVADDRAIFYKSCRTQLIIRKILPTPTCITLWQSNVHVWQLQKTSAIIVEIVPQRTFFSCEILSCKILPCGACAWLQSQKKIFDCMQLYNC